VRSATYRYQLITESSYSAQGNRLLTCENSYRYRLIAQFELIL